MTRNAETCRPTINGLYLVSTMKTDDPQKVARWCDNHWRTVGDRIDDDNRIPDGRVESWKGPLVVATPTPPLAGAELPTERETLLGDIEWLLAEGRKIATDEAPDEGRHFDHKFQAIRRLMTGQTVGISLRYLERIIAALKATSPALPEARPLTISDDLPDLLFRRCGLSQDGTMRLAEEIRAMVKATAEADTYHRLRDWLADPNRKPPELAFTAGVLRDAAAAFWDQRSLLMDELRAAEARTKALEEQLAAPGTTTIAERQKWFDLKERLAKLESDRECREQYIVELQAERDALKAEVERLRREVGEASTVSKSELAEVIEHQTGKVTER